MKVSIRSHLSRSGGALILDGNQSLSDSDLKQLADLSDRQRRKITTVVLSRTSIKGKGIKHLKSLPNLTSLFLQGTRITDDAPLDSLPECIEVLNLDDTKVGDVGVARLRGLTRLRILRLGRTAVTDRTTLELLRSASLREVHLEETATSGYARRRLENNIVLNDPGVSAALWYVKFCARAVLGVLVLRARIDQKQLRYTFAH